MVHHDDDDADSYGAFDASDHLLDTNDHLLDTNDQLLDTLTEYQQKLEKTNLIDEADDDWPVDADRGPVPVPRRRAAAAADKPRSTDPPDLESPSDSIDVSELEEDEYLDC